MDHEWIESDSIMDLDEEIVNKKNETERAEQPVYYLFESIRDMLRDSNEYDLLRYMTIEMTATWLYNDMYRKHLSTLEEKPIW